MKPGRAATRAPFGVDARTATPDRAQRRLAAEHTDVVVESDGVDGLWTAAEHGYYDVVVLGIMLPGLSAATRSSSGCVHVTNGRRC